MIARLVLPITVIVLAGCGRQATTAQAQAPAQAAPAKVATSAPAPRTSPVVSAEIADPPSVHRVAPTPVRQEAQTSKPSAFAPRQRVTTTRTVTETHEIVIPAGTRIEVRLAQTLDTKYARPGDHFAATLDSPIVSGNQVIVPRGTAFDGIVEESKPSGRFKGRAVLMLRLRSFRLNGVTHRISTAPDTAVSGNHRKRNLIFMGGGPAAGAGIGAIAAGGPGALIGAGAGAVAGTTTAFFTGKKQVKLPVETRMVFSLKSGVPLRRG